jgi:hypothetical protein
LYLKGSITLGEGRGNAFIVFLKRGRKEIAVEAVVRDLQRELYQRAKQGLRCRATVQQVSEWGTMIGGWSAMNLHAMSLQGSIMKKLSLVLLPIVIPGSFFRTTFTLHRLFVTEGTVSDSE